MCLLNLLLRQDVKEVHHSSPQQRAVGFSKILSTLGVVDEIEMTNSDYIQMALLKQQPVDMEDALKQAMDSLIGRKVEQLIIPRWLKIGSGAVTKVSLAPAQTFSVAQMGYEIGDDGPMICISRIKFLCEESYDYLAEEIRNLKAGFDLHFGKVDQEDAIKWGLGTVTKAIATFKERDEKLFLAEARCVCTSWDTNLSKTFKLIERKGVFALSDGGPAIFKPHEAGIDLLEVLLELGSKVDNII